MRASDCLITASETALRPSEEIMPCRLRGCSITRASSLSRNSRPLILRKMFSTSFFPLTADRNLTLYWYSPSRMVRLPSETSARLRACSISFIVIPACRSLVSSGSTSSSDETHPLRSTMATSGSCSMRLVMTWAAKRLSAENSSDTGNSSSRSVAGCSSRRVRLM